MSVDCRTIKILTQGNKNAEVMYPVKGATPIGNGMRLDPGVGVCGKDGQSVPVGVASRRCGLKM